jgi:cytochrome c oxidase subunit III
MSAASATVPESNVPWSLPARGPVAMYCLIAAETAIFTIFLVAYIYYVGKSLTGPR